MKKNLIFVALLSFMVACSTIPKGSLQSDELRLVNLTLTEIGPRKEGGKNYQAMIEYQKGERVKPEEIKEASLSLFQFQKG